MKRVRTRRLFPLAGIALALTASIGFDQRVPLLAQEAPDAQASGLSAELPSSVRRNKARMRSIKSRCENGLVM